MKKIIKQNRSKI